MGALKPAFQKEGGTVTAANSSKINDGAAALVIASAEKARELGAKPLARIVDWCGVAAGARVVHDGAHRRDPEAPEEDGLSVADIDLFEINEAFAAVAMAAIKELARSREGQRPRRRRRARPPDRRLGRRGS